MAKKMSQTFKEILQLIVFLLVVGLIALVFLIYPLNRTSALMGRIESINEDTDSLPLNDPATLIEAGFAVDTFRVDADGLTSLAVAMLTPGIDSSDSSDAKAAFEPRGTVILLHDECHDRNATIPLARVLVDSGFTVIVYDQRASGFSSGDYHSYGEYEATDLEETIAYADMRGKITPPLVAVGWSIGADAALAAAREETRIDAVVAINPYLSAENWLNRLFDEYDTFWIPFPHTVFWFWYKLRSGYAPEYTDLNDISKIASPTLLMAPPKLLESSEYVHLAKISDSALLKQMPLPDEESALQKTIVSFVLAAAAAATAPQAESAQ